MSKNLTFKIVGIFAITLIVFSLPVSAQLVEDDQDTSQSKLVQSTSSESIRKCQQVQNRLSDYLSEAEESNLAYTEEYQRQIDEISNIAIRLNEANDIDSETLVDHVRKLNDLLAELEVKFGQFTANLRSMTNLPCDGQTRIDEIKAKLGDVRDLQGDLRDVTSSIEVLLSQTIVDELSQLKTETDNGSGAPS